MKNMLNTLKAKKSNKKGFTLMEMLIVVAIIAILVAVSIPVFTSQLNAAKEATDDANMRAAKAVAVTSYLTHDIDDSVVVPTTTTNEYYDAEAGKFVDTKPADYGKAAEGVIKVTGATDGEFEFTWSAT